MAKLTWNGPYKSYIQILYKIWHFVLKCWINQHGHVFFMYVINKNILILLYRQQFVISVWLFSYVLCITNQTIVLMYSCDFHVWVSSVRVFVTMILFNCTKWFTKCPPFQSSAKSYHFYIKPSYLWINDIKCVHF